MDETTSLREGAGVRHDSGAERFTAYELWENPGFTIEPAPAKRGWMDEFPHRVPYRCLPINMANQAGWLVRTPVAFSVTWSGKHELDAIKITFLERLKPEREDVLRRHIKSNFGGGILTFAFPWLFRTPRGIGLWVRGPANLFRHNARAIEGLVESDWAHAPFTMNWKIERRNDPAYFRAGDSVCMLTPFPLDLLESLAPEIRRISDEPELHDRFERARRERNETLRKAYQEHARGFELNYMRGEQLDGEKWKDHRTNLKLHEFADRRGTD
jgi:hypothetical protein